MSSRRLLGVGVLLCGLGCATAGAATVVFFNPSQIATNVASGVTSDTISSSGYQFTYTRDKLFTGGLGPDPIGRSVRVPWPDGVEAQAVTTPPPGGTSFKAKIIVQRVDGDVFDFTSFTGKLLANTGATGAAFEIMPSLNGEDGFNDPLYFDASGYYSQSFSYDSSPNYWGSTALLKGFDRYTMDLFVDFALTALTLEGAPVPGVMGDYNDNSIVDAADYTVWRDAVAAGSTSLTNDSTPGTVDESDFLFWRTHFGESTGSGAAAASASAVPEPSTLVMLLAAALVILCGRRVVVS